MKYIFVALFDLIHLFNVLSNQFSFIYYFIVYFYDNFGRRVGLRKVTSSNLLTPVCWWMLNGLNLWDIISRSKRVSNHWSDDWKCLKTMLTKLVDLVFQLVFFTEYLSTVLFRYSWFNDTSCLRSLLVAINGELHPKFERRIFFLIFITWIWSTKRYIFQSIY